MSKFFNHLLFAVIISLPTALVNARLAFNDISVSIININVTVVFLIAWIVYSFFMGVKVRKDFLIFTIIYNGLTLICFYLLINFENTILLYLIGLTLSPMYPISYYIFTNMPYFKPYLTQLTILMLFFTVVISYLLGFIYKMKLKNKFK